MWAHQNGQIKSGIEKEKSKNICTNKKKPYTSQANVNAIHTCACYMM